MTLDIGAKRIYEAPVPDDGYRVLIDHIWPRGISKDRAKLDEWAKELAPSGELRKWFNHDPERFEEFRARYRKELLTQRERLEKLRRLARDGRVTILYAARDEEHSNAAVLVELLRERSAHGR